MRKWSGSCLKCLKLGTTEDREISAFNSSLKRSMFQRRWVPPHLHKHIQIITLAPAKVRSNLKALDAFFSKELSQFAAFRMQLIVIRQLCGGSCQSLCFPLGDHTKDPQQGPEVGTMGLRFKTFLSSVIVPQDGSNVVPPQARPGFDLDHIFCTPSCGNEGIALLDRKYNSWER